MLQTGDIEEDGQVGTEVKPSCFPPRVSSCFGKPNLETTVYCPLPHSRPWPSCRVNQDCPAWDPCSELCSVMSPLTPCAFCLLVHLFPLRSVHSAQEFLEIQLSFELLQNVYIHDPNMQPRIRLINKYKIPTLLFLFLQEEKLLERFFF